MITKYKLVSADLTNMPKYNKLIGHRSSLLPCANGDYVRYSDHVKCMDQLVDKNFSLDVRCCELEQDNETLKVKLTYCQQSKEDLIQVIAGLNKALMNKEYEITAISDKLNRLLVGKNIPYSSMNSARNRSTAPCNITPPPVLNMNKPTAPASLPLIKKFLSDRANDSF